MSAGSLQRVAVRMLYDEAFLDRVYEDVDAATGDCDLTGTERNWLRMPDRRAWSVDPHRRSRSLAALIEEFAVSVALYVRATPAAARRLDAFFSSREFHLGMQRGASLAAIFAEWFESRRDVSAADLLRVEASLARVRREFESGIAAPAPGLIDTSTTVFLSPAVEVLEFGAGTVTRFSAVLGGLRRGEVAERAMDPTIELASTSPDSGEREGVLVDGRHEDPRLEILSVELGRVLAAASAPVNFREFARRASVHGADEADCLAILSSFSGDGIVLVARR